MKNRRQEQILEMKENIVSAAREIAMEKGWNSVSIRNIAAKIDYSPPLLYNYFRNKDDILGELQLEGFKTLKKKFSKISKKEKSQDALIQVSEFYVAFALENPDLYHLMYNMQGVQCNSEKGMIEMTQARKIVVGILKKIAKKSGYSSEELYIAWLSAVHGFVALHMADYLDLPLKTRKNYIRGTVSRLMQSVS